MISCNIVFQEEVEELFSEGEIDENGMINYFEICQAVAQ